MEWAASLAGPLEIDVRTWWLALSSAFGAGFLLGALPVGAAEAVALAIGALPSIRVRIGVMVPFTAGHVLGKMLWFWLGTLGSRVTQRHLRAWIDRARLVAERHPRIGLGVAASSSIASIPPFHLTTVAAGLVHSPPAPFVVVAFLGRLVRFSVLAMFPPLVRYLSSLG
jgi:membrane protein YqaA with SNARE-associated domain